LIKLEVQFYTYFIIIAMKKLFALLFMIACINVNAQKMEDYIAPAFPSDLVANHAGNAVAWVFNEKGIRNIYIGQPQNNKYQALTQFTMDDGIEINSLQFSPNDDILYYVRGNTVNTKGEPANPAQLQTTTEQNIYALTIATKEIKKIAKGSGFTISPDGKLLVFALGGKAWKVNLTKEPFVSEPLFLARGAVSGLHFNNSGNYISFVSSREEHSFIGVYILETNNLKYLDPSTYVDSDPVWNTQGTQIAFIRRPNIRHEVLFDPKPTSQQPWQLMVVDVASGKATNLFTADLGKGSVWVNDLPAGGNKIAWTKNNTIVFPWEKTGWVHLYSIQLDNKKVKELTPGNGEVETMQLQQDKETIIYVTNISDINRRHIWTVNSNGGSPVLVTPGTHIDYNPAVLKTGVAYLSASATKPAWPHFMSGNESNPIAAELFPTNFPSNLVTPKTIMVKATDGNLAPAQLFLPNNYDPTKKYPAVIFLHGGSRRQMLEGFNYSSYYSNAYALNEYFASQGYIVMALNYRSGIGYGLDFREAKNYGMTGASEVRDLIGAGEYLKSRKDVDAKRIGLWGGSYGGYLTAHGLAQRGDLFATGVDIHGVHNWNDEEPTFTPWYDSLLVTAYAQRAYKSSPVNYAKNWKNPTLFIHGDDDRNVPFTETIHMIHQLRKQGVEVEEKILPDEIHGFLMYKSWLMVDEHTFEFINRKFKK
jgi:dipeptidyl aminopeptidase/acylaminoacyl peptidase